MSDNSMTPIASLVQGGQNNSNKVYKVLIVDDEPDQREIFSDLFSTSSNYEVSTAVDGIDALAKCEATKFDLILLDIVMPRKDGVQALSEIKANPAKYGNPRVLMLTNIGGDIAIEEALKFGAVGYRVKIDTEPEDLLKTVQEELDKLNAANAAPQPAAA